MRWRALLVTIAALGATPGCSRSQPAASQAAPAAAAGVERTGAPPSRACDMLPVAEVSTLLARTVDATADEGNGSTQCTYAEAGRSLPVLTVKVERGGGEAAMAATRLLGRLEPEMAEALEGVGDEASAIGPALMVRTGEDLVTLTFFGVDETPAAARQILTRLRPRLGPSAAPSAAEAGDGRATADPAVPDEARALLGGLLGALTGETGGKDRGGSGETGGPTTGGGPAARRTEARAPEPVFPAFDGPRPRVPLVEGLTVVASRHEPGRGDYEPIVQVTSIDARAVRTTWSANLPEGTRPAVRRTVRREDLDGARTLRGWFVEGDPEVYAGTTAFGVSRAVHADLAKGRAEVTFVTGTDGASLVDVLTGDDVTTERLTLTRVEPHAVALPVLVNGRSVLLPAIHARTADADDPFDYYVLDDPDNPLALRAVGRNAAQVTEIRFPEAATATRLEQAMEEERRVELHGIFFDFGKTTIRPESALAIGEIADLLAKHPDWRVTLEGHTDDIGGDAYNVDLSTRRAAAIERALVDQHHVAAWRLQTAGFGASRPRASNATLSGRARNRRVEMVRQ